MAFILTLVQFAKLRKKRICRSKKNDFLKRILSTMGVDKFFDFDCQKDIKKGKNLARCRDASRRVSTARCHFFSCSIAKAYAPMATADDVPSLVTPTPTHLVGSYQTSWLLNGTLIILPDFSVKRIMSCASIRL